MSFLERLMNCDTRRTFVEMIKHPENVPVLVFSDIIQQVLDMTLSTQQECVDWMIQMLDTHELNNVLDVAYVFKSMYRWVNKYNIHFTSFNQLKCRTGCALSDLLELTIPKDKDLEIVRLIMDSHLLTPQNKPRVCIVITKHMLEIMQCLVTKYQAYGFTEPGEDEKELNKMAYQLCSISLDNRNDTMVNQVTVLLKVSPWVSRNTKHMMYHFFVKQRYFEHEDLSKSLIQWINNADPFVLDYTNPKNAIKNFVFQHNIVLN